MRRPWRESVLDALHRLSHGSALTVISRKQVISEELPRIIAETQTPGQTPEQSLSYWLQDLRDDGLLVFMARGRYRLVRPVVDAETFDGTELELDNAVKERRLRIGRVETRSELALQRQRRGQARVRELALANYSYTCAICDSRKKDFLIASHITPWADSVDGRGDLANVIILCRPHDALFEFGYWSLDDDLNVLRHEEVQNAWSTQALLPETVTFRKPMSYSPGLQYLKEHRTRHGFVG